MQRISHRSHNTNDLEPIHKQIEEIKMVINHNTDHHNKLHEHALTNLDMTGRALVALKMQRDVDRKRRLQFIKRTKKHLDKQKKQNLQLKLAVVACLLLTIISLFH